MRSVSGAYLEISQSLLWLLSSFIDVVVGMDQGERSQGFGDTTFGAQPAGFAVISRKLEIPLGGDGDGCCFAVVHHAGELDVDRVFGWSRLVLAEYEAHYNGRRPHRSRELRPPRPDHPVADLSHERINVMI
jgi:hypothetical protein